MISRLFICVRGVAAGAAQCLALIGVGLTAVLSAQSLAFEVATVKVNRSGEKRPESARLSITAS